MFQYVELVTVFASMDPGLVAAAKSVLDRAGFRYFVEIQVDKEDLEDARLLLKELR